MIFNLENGQRKLVREHWYEWMRMEVPETHNRRPMFFLPTRRHCITRVVVFWIIPLAIPALIYSITRNILMNIWYDCLEFSDLTYREWRIKRIERRVKETERAMRGEDIL